MLIELFVIFISFLYFDQLLGGINRLQLQFLSVYYYCQAKTIYSGVSKGGLGGGGHGECPLTPKKLYQKIFGSFLQNGKSQNRTHTSTRFQTKQCL